jgi:low affinity Fe/Cu permease
MKINEVFRRFSTRTSEATGSPWAFIIATTVIVVWGVSGPLFKFSDTWQLVINTSTTIVTFLMVFLIQNTQNRDAKAMHLKVDELIRAIDGARDQLIDLENSTDEELEHLHMEMHDLAVAPKLDAAHAQAAIAHADSAVAHADSAVAHADAAVAHADATAPHAAAAPLAPHAAPTTGLPGEGLHGSVAHSNGLAPNNDHSSHANSSFNQS